MINGLHRKIECHEVDNWSQAVKRSANSHAGESHLKIKIN
jgi:hypothetical protein